METRRKWGTGVPVQGGRGARFLPACEGLGLSPWVSGQSCQKPPSVLQVHCWGRCCSGPWICMVCVRVCACVTVCVRGQPLSHMQVHALLCPFPPWTVLLPPSGSLTLPGCHGCSGASRSPHRVRVAFHSYMLINVCPLPALSRGILVTPGIRLTPSS